MPCTHWTTHARERRMWFIAFPNLTPFSFSLSLYIESPITTSTIKTTGNYTYTMYVLIMGWEGAVGVLPLPCPSEAVMSCIFHKTRWNIEWSVGLLQSKYYIYSQTLVKQSDLQPKEKKNHDSWIFYTLRYYKIVFHFFFSQARNYSHQLPLSTQQQEISVT